MDPIVLDAVGITPVPGGFPAAASCPGCGGRLNIYRDFAHRDFWLICLDCSAQGNLVEFAAQVWKCNTDRACNRLQATLPTPVAKWLDRQLLDSIQRLQTLNLFDDERTCSLLRDDGCLRAAVHRRGLDLQSPDGVSSVHHLVYACGPELLRPAVVERPSSKDRKRVARCHGNLAILPVWDRPGRAIGALTIRSGTDEQVFMRMKPSSSAGGLSFAHLLLPRDPEFFSTVFARVDDPWSVCRLHWLDRRMCGDTHLPLAGISTTMASPERGFNWQERPIILWVDQVNVAVIALAERLPARLSLVPYVADQLATPRNWLRIVEKAACDWQQALQELILTCTPETVVDAVRELRLSTESGRQITRNWEWSPRERLLQATHNSIRCGDYTYEEYGGVLLRSKKAGAVEIVSHHRVRIDQVIRTPDGDYYRGRLLHREGEAPFVELAETFKRSSAWTHDCLFGAGATPEDMPSIRKWKDVARVAMRLSPPVTVKGAVTMGWDATLGVFVFDGFQIRVNGKCEESIPPTWLGPARPTIGLLPPGPLPPAGLRELLAGHASLPYLIAAIAARIIAPALNKTLPPLALVGDCSVRAARLAEIMGCSRPADWHHKVPVALGWPCVLNGTRQQKTKAAKRLRKASANTIVAVTELELKALSVHQPWQRLRCPARSLPPIPLAGSEAEEVLRMMIPAFLAHLCKRYRIGGLPRHKGGFLARVYKALASWLYSQPGAEGIRAPQLRLHVDVDDPIIRATACFAAMLRELVDNEDIRAVAQAVDRPALAAEVVLLPDGSCEIDCKAVAEIMQRRSAIPVAWKRLGKALTEANVITSWRRPEAYSSLAQPEVWTLTPGWWEANVAGPLAARTKQQPPPSTLKTAG